MELALILGYAAGPTIGGGLQEVYVFGSDHILALF